MRETRLLHSRPSEIENPTASGDKMQLPQTAEYALRAMAFLATATKGGAVRSKDLSVETGIPAHYLSKILRKLVLQGLLLSQKGHGGGFVLAREAQEITFIEILTSVGYRPEPDRCSFGWGGCDPDNPCPLHPAWSQLNESFWVWATKNTLANVTLSDRSTLDQLKFLRTSP